jgi:hypothetical protein
MQIYLGVGVDANVALPKHASAHHGAPPTGVDANVALLKHASAHHGAPPTGVDANVALEWHNRRQVSATECR